MATVEANVELKSPRLLEENMSQKERMYGHPTLAKC